MREYMANAVNGKTELASMIPTIWSPMMYQRLRETLVFGNIFSREYEGEISSVGDTVKVNQIGAITSEVLSDDKASFSSQALSINSFTVVANKRAVAAVEVTDMAKLQSIEFQQELQNELTFKVMKDIEDQIIAALLPSTSSPDHTIAPAAASDLAPVDLTTMRALGSRALWPLQNRYFVCAPEYYSDLTNKTQITSFDFTKVNDSGEAQVNLFAGFRIMESNVLAADVGYACHPSALQLVLQRGVTVKASDLHSQNKFGMLISADVIFGLSLFDNKRIIQISG